MKKTTLLGTVFVLLLIMSAVQADEYSMVVVDPEIKKSDLADIKVEGAKISKFEKGKNFSVLPRDINATLERLNINTAQMDQLDKDLLYRRAQKFTLKRLTNRYPKIPKGQLAKLQEVVKKVIK